MGGTRSITSRDNPKFKALRTLATDAREWRRQGRTLLDGPHLVATYRDQVGLPEALVIRAGAQDHPEVGQLLQSMPRADVLELPEALFREICGVVTPVGILALIPVPASRAVTRVADCVVLDAVQDTGNVGTIIRTAAAAGFETVVLGPGCAGAWSPRVMRAAQGAHFSLDVQEVPDLVAFLGDYGGSRLAAVAREGDSLYSAGMPAPAAWVFGNEGAGISPVVLSAVDRHVTIPMAGHSESLNVAAAAAICLFETRRQRLAQGEEK